MKVNDYIYEFVAASVGERITSTRLYQHVASKISVAPDTCSRKLRALRSRGLVNYRSEGKGEFTILSVN